MLQSIVLLASLMQGADAEAIRRAQAAFSIIDPPAAVQTKTTGACECATIPTKPAVKDTVTTQQVLKIVNTTRSPLSPHTHSHRAADGTIHTWDHPPGVPASHTCPVLVVRNGKVVPCGAYQNVQDSGRRPVTVSHVVRTEMTQQATEQPVASPAPVVTYMPASVARFSSVSSSACANGNCSMARRRF